MKALFDNVSAATSKITTRSYSTSFSLGIYCLNKKIHRPIYNIYGFVRFADEIVDTFHEYNKATLLKEFKEETDWYIYNVGNNELIGLKGKKMEDIFPSHTALIDQLIPSKNKQKKMGQAELLIVIAALNK